MLRRILKFSVQYRSLLKPTPFNAPLYSFNALNTIPKNFYSKASEKNPKTESSEEEDDDAIETSNQMIIEETPIIETDGVNKTQKQDKDIAFTEHCQIIKAGDKTLIKSEYGTFELKGSILPPRKVEQVQTLYYVNNGVSVNFLRKVLKSDPNGIVVFDPTTHFANVQAIYNGYKKKLYAQFYGTHKKPRNPYKSCKTNNDIFNLSRRIKIQIKSFLSRICFIIDYDGTLRLKGDNIPISDTLVALLRKTNENKEENTKEKEDNKVGFYKHHFLVSVGFWQGVHSSDEWEKGGITVSALSDKKIYPLYSVWSPTSQNYLSLLEEYLEDRENMIKSRKNILDIGCGTGVLSFMVVQKTGAKDIYAIDRNNRAVECTNLNAQILDMTDSVKAKKLDLVEAVKKGNTAQTLKDLKLPQKYELMIANPPWVIASLLNTEHELDNGVYDPKETFLKAIFKFASEHLSVQSPLSKNGILLLYYSDLSQILGVQPKNRIEDLCKEHGLVITDTMTTKFIDDYEMGGYEKDPLMNFKNQSKVILYEITRQS